MSWWSPTKCHIQTVVINLNSQRLGMYLPNSINKMFPLCLITLFHFKDYNMFLMHPVYWCEIMVSEKVGPIILVSLDTSHTNLTACDGTSCNSMGFSTNIYYSGPPLWSSGQSFWLQIQRSRVRFPALPDFLSSSGSGTGSTQPREVN